MKPALSKETALKAALLLVLAANISWTPFKSLNSVNLAEESAAPTPKRPARFELNRPNIAPAPGAQPRAAMAPAARVTTETTPATYHEELRNWCGVSILIKWEAVDGSNEVRTSVVRRFPNEQVIFTRKQAGNFDSRVNNTPARDDELKYLETETRSHLGSACADAQTVAAGSPSSTTPNSQNDEAKKRLDADIKNCKRASDGKQLDAATRLECNTDRLGSIESFDDDDHKAKRDAQTQFNSVVDQITKDLRHEVKASLLSDDQSGARELVDNAVSSIGDAGQDIGISQAAIQKAIQNIRNMYGAEVKGKQLKDKADQAKEQMEALRDQYDNAVANRDMAQANGDMWGLQSAQSQLSSSMLQGQYYANTINNTLTSGMNELRQFQRMNWIDASDYSDFTSSIQAMNPQLNFFRNGGRMTTPGALPSADQITVGADIGNVRSDLANRYQSIYGGIPARPQLNFTPSSTSPTRSMMPTSVFSSADPRVGNRG